MRKSKTIKRDFYNLVIKIFVYTVISTIVTYGILIMTMSLRNSKPTDYYVKYINQIAEEVKKNGDSILNGNLINIKKYNEELQGEVIDLSGNHLYGENGVKNDKFDILISINQEKYDNNYIYRYIGITQNNSIKAIYVIKAPFDYIINNYKTNMGATLIYILFMILPIIYFLLYLFIFTSKLYKSMSKNINILLGGVQKISDGDYDFYIDGVEGREFNKIQESFNTMVKVLRGNIEDLSTLDEERRMMVSSIAHDIRTPITVIKGQIEIIDDLKDKPNYKMDDNMKIINKNCDRMTTLTDNLSLFYKVEGENFLLKNEKVDLEKLLKDKQIEIRSMAEKKNVEIEFKINLKKQKYVLDENMLFRVLDNVLYNSLRFTQKGKITLEAYDDVYDMNKINFKCSDTGTGFKQKDTSKLFKAFYQDEDYKNHFGLGLYISQKIINNYNGKIEAYDNQFGGATIEFYIKELEEYFIS
ncbi:HAMP domain-containing sensor histidine kinase [Clostridium uliginosum]|uniref:histidine kinase n=1 Tax=Clostridium uliginosum TaxID=119641 RepID=A0A1I1JPK4_9CLOT|nr:HAMP domain-containing sensor histidine kinase [Clostridium uliginosum]SFC47320.1 Signal transduction histidine kinase [Clostridium uliginosum]